MTRKLARVSPFTLTFPGENCDLEYFHRNALELFDSFFDQFLNPTFHQKAKDAFNNRLEYPKTDSYFDEENNIVFELAVPGLEKSDVAIELQNDTLTVSYSKTYNLNDDNCFDKEDEKSKRKWITRELKHSSFKRQWAVPEELIDESDGKKISSNLENGILTVKIPIVKKQEEKPQKRLIEIE